MVYEILFYSISLIWNFSMYKVNLPNKSNIFGLMKDKHTKRTVLTDIYFHLNDTDKIHYMYISQQKTFCRVNTHYQSSIDRFVSTSQIASFYTFLTNSHVLDINSWWEGKTLQLSHWAKTAARAQHCVIKYYWIP